MTGAEQSLISFLDTPVIIGDPEGRAAYVNPAFESCFETSQEEVGGQSLAQLFEGGGREAVLRAVADVCQYGESVRFRVRERGTGFAAVASPIVAQDSRVGVVILLKEEVDGVERLLALHREIRDPLDELAHALEALVEQTGGRRDDRYRAQVEDAMRALERLRKWTEQANMVLCGGTNAVSRKESFDPARLVRNVAERVERDGATAGTQVEVVAAPVLPSVRADERQLEAMLVRLVRDRLDQADPPRSMMIAARQLDTPDEAAASGVLISITERSGEGGYDEPLGVPALIKEVVATSGGAIHTAADPHLGRTTVIRLPVS